MEADFSGWATKSGIKCSDGRTILPNAFSHQDQMKVPLVWQHMHGSVDNILGHAILESRPEGVYAYGFFNDSPDGEKGKIMVKHGDVTSLSIYANNLEEQNKHVKHGDIRELSLVIAGANRGAVIDNVNIQHGDEIATLDDEVVIDLGIEFDSIEHAAMPATKTKTKSASADDTSDDEEGPTVEDVWESLTPLQQEVMAGIIGQAAGASAEAETEAAGTAKHSESDEESEGEESEEETEETEDEKSEDEKVEEQEDTKSDDTESEAKTVDGEESGDELNHSQEGSDMSRNVFEQAETEKNSLKAAKTLSHSEIETIVNDAQVLGKLSDSIIKHAAEYGIEDIDLLFPDAKAITNTPDFLQRRTEWVQDVLSSTKHSPFSRIKSLVADITADEARAKGYVKGNLKKDEIIKMLKRVTTPKTIYKKQKLDRDDIVDIVDFDVVVWLKQEMRLMLDEELARAILIGDGREADDEDKIDEDHIRPIAYDIDMYTTVVTLDGGATPADKTDAIIRAQRYYKGTGTPALYTTLPWLTDLLLQKDTLGRRLYGSLQELASALLVTKIVAVEPMESQSEVEAILVNLTDYTIGADNGGAVSMFDDFDIDYNQNKYLIETRVSGALTKPKAAVVFKVESADLVTPTAPSYDGSTHVITIPTVAGVDYTIDGDVVTGTVTITEDTTVEAEPQAGKAFPENTTSTWFYSF